MPLLETSYDPRTGEPSTTVPVTAPAEVDQAMARATTAYDVLRATSPAERGEWLRTAAAALEEAEAELVVLADRETALGVDRLSGEIRRAADQLRFYADAAVEGSYLAATISTAASLRRIAVPVGPVAVFGASNFPFAFGAVGNDVASAIAAGCPVVVKVHPAHLATGRRATEVVQQALESAGAPVGILQVVAGYDGGLALVDHPDLAAVAFTGSESGGTSLWRRAHERSVPIPVYAEMGTVNAVVVLGSAAARRDEIAAGFVASCTAGGGQFCTKPGLLLVPSGQGFPERVAEALLTAAPRPVMLTGAIADGVRRGVAELERAGATVLATTGEGRDGWAAPAAILTAPIDELRPGSRLLEECFGAVALVVEHDDPDTLVSAISRLPGALAAAIFADPADPDAPAVVDALQRRVGRLVMEGWTTGVAVDEAQHHGGPWPATTDARATSVGAAALERFVRPVAFQGVADELLPAGIQDANPWGIHRVVR